MCGVPGAEKPGTGSPGPTWKGAVMTQPFNEQEALEQVGGDTDLLRELIDVFRQECPALLEQIHTAIAQGHAADLQRAAHTLKGSARVLGAAPAAEVAARLEQMGHAGQVAEARGACRTLEAEIDRLMAALNRRSDHAPNNTRG